MTYPIYTYGSGYIEWYALSSIAALTSSTLFAATLKVMGLLAAFTVFIGLLSPKSPITQGGHIKIGIGFISILLVSMLIFGPKINVAVIDSVSPLAIPNGGVVNNVPIGVGLPISLASQVANGLVNGVENAFSSPAVGGPGASTDFTSAGMGVAISMPLQSYSDSITDPTLQSNFNYYFENCIDPAIANGTVSPSEIADAGLANPINNVSNAPTTFQAQSLWSLFQSISNQIPGPGGLTTNFINPTTGSNSTVACQNDYTNVYDEASSYGQTFFQQESESLGYTSYSAVSSLLSNINQNVLNVGNDGMQEQMQAFAVNLTNSAIPQIAAASGITSTQAAYSTGLAEAGWGASIAPMLLTAQQFMPGMLSLLFVVITIASPFLLMFLMFPWGGRYLQVYMTLLLWMVLWLPMAAVINFVLQLIEHESFLYNYSVQGYSLASAGIVNHFFMGQLEIATVLMTAIPIFTYYLASASSMGMVMLAGTIDSSIKGGSMAAANSSMQGANMDNTSIGNTSMHNFSGYGDSAYNYSTYNGSGFNNSYSNDSSHNKSNYNDSSHNINSDSISTMIGGNAIKGTTSNAREVESIMSQNGLSESQKAEKLAKSGFFTGTVTGKSKQGLSTYSIANRAIDEKSDFSGDNTAKTLINTPGGPMIGNVSSYGIGSNGKLVTADFKNGITRTETLNSAQAKELGLPGAGQYNISETASGQIEAVRATNGAIKTGVNADGFAGSTTYAYNSKTGKFTPVYTKGDIGSNLNTDNINNTTDERFNLKKNGHLGQYYREKQYRLGNNLVVNNGNTFDSGNVYKIPGYSSNQAFLKSGQYMDNYAIYSPGGAGVIDMMKNKDTGAAATFIHQTQEMMQKYGGHINKLNFSAKQSMEIIGKTGASFLGNGIKTRLTASISSGQEVSYSANALYTNTGEQLHKYASEYKKGEITWGQFTRSVNGLVSTYKKVVEIGSLPGSVPTTTPAKTKYSGFGSLSNPYE